MSKEKIVTTIQNQELPISQCRKFTEGYYKIGDINVENSGDCYQIDDKFFRFETGQVVFDNEKLQYVIKNNSVIEGVISIDEHGYNLGFFSMTDKNITINTINGRYLAINEGIFENNKTYRERLSDGEYYHIQMLDAREFGKMRPPSNEYKTSLPYDSGGVLKNYIAVYDKLDVELSENVKNYHSVLGNLTFGLEFETVAGFVPDRIIYQTGLIPLRDGSISGLEYVTIPLSGEKGLQTVINASKCLEKRTRYDETCALHLHLGNIPRTPEFILAFFKLTCFLQNEMYTLFPLYKKYNFKVKNKNYSEPYDIYDLISKMDCSITPDKINSNFEVLYSYLSMGESFSALNNNLDNVKNHPADREGRAKWNIRTRYHLNNFIPLIFGNKQTIEFRIHTPTFDVNKIIPFLIINASLVNFTMENTKKILEDKYFLSNRRIGDIVAAHIQKNCTGKNVSRLMDSIYGYINGRQQVTAQENRNGNIRGNESAINGCKYIDWNKGPSEPVSSDKVKKLRLDLEEKYSLEILDFETRVIDMVRRNQLSTRDADRHITNKRTEINTRIEKEINNFEASSW